jgi:hypothetical protein
MLMDSLQFRRSLPARTCFWRVQGKRTSAIGSGDQCIGIRSLFVISIILSLSLSLSVCVCVCVLGYLDSMILISLEERSSTVCVPHTHMHNMNTNSTFETPNNPPWFISGHNGYMHTLNTLKFFLNTYVHACMHTYVRTDRRQFVGRIHADIYMYAV